MVNCNREQRISEQFQRFQLAISNMQRYNITPSTHSQLPDWYCEILYSLAQFHKRHFHRSSLCCFLFSPSTIMVWQCNLTISRQPNERILNGQWWRTRVFNFSTGQESFFIHPRNALTAKYFADIESSRFEEDELPPVFQSSSPSTTSELFNCVSSSYSSLSLCGTEGQIGSLWPRIVCNLFLTANPPFHFTGNNLSPHPLQPDKLH